MLNQNYVMIIHAKQGVQKYLYVFYDMLIYKYYMIITLLFETFDSIYFKIKIGTVWFLCTEL